MGIGCIFIKFQFVQVQYIVLILGHVYFRLASQLAVSPVTCCVACFVSVKKLPVKWYSEGLQSWERKKRSWILFFALSIPVDRGFWGAIVAMSNNGGVSSRG